MSGESHGDYSGAREASAEEREFHAQQSNGTQPDAPRPSEPPAERTEAPPRESSSEGSQAPLDLPPPPPAKPFVVWSSSPGDGDTRRDE